jgi:hypothetical protein
MWAIIGIVAVGALVSLFFRSLSKPTAVENAAQSGDKAATLAMLIHLLSAVTAATWMFCWCMQRAGSKINAIEVTAALLMSTFAAGVGYCLGIFLWMLILFSWWMEWL